MDSWVDLSPYFDEMWEIGRRRTVVKGGYASSKYYNLNSSEVGMLGEKLVGLLINEEPKKDVSILGDGGSDFRGILEVKANTFLSDPDLIEFPDKKTAPIYALAAINVAGKCGKFMGHITGGDFKKIAVIKNYGYGSRLVVNHKKLNKSIPELIALVEGSGSYPAPNDSFMESTPLV